MFEYVFICYIIGNPKSDKTLAKTVFYWILTLFFMIDVIRVRFPYALPSHHTVFPRTAKEGTAKNAESAEREALPLCDLCVLCG
jgi:hypothetical protein